MASTHPLIDPTLAAALPSYLLNELDTHIETDQTSTGPSMPGLQSHSVYGSEYRNCEADTEEQEQEEDASPDDLVDLYDDPAKLLQYRCTVAVRMEEEED
jgi:hypothetical protein